MIYVWTEKKEKEREKERYMEKRRKMSECKKKNLIEGEKKKFVGRKNEEISIYNQCIYFVVLDFKRIFRKGRERNFFRSFFCFICDGAVRRLSWKGLACGAASNFRIRCFVGRCGFLNFTLRFCFTMTLEEDRL